MKLASGTFKRKIIAQLGRCYYCGVILEGKIEIDHILPFSKYKNGKRKNLCLSCVRCNRLKLDKDLDSFRALLSNIADLENDLFYFEKMSIYHD